MKIKRFFPRIFLSVISIALIICLPSVKLINNDNFELIYKAFLGNKSEYEGIIEIWNIDSFEGGTISKKEILEKVSKTFQKRNKGLYVMVRNLSEQECLNLILQGAKPDLFSCSYGVAEKLKDYVQDFQNVNISNIDDAVRKAGMVDESLFGVAWCKGGYFLISTNEKIQKTKHKDDDNVKLSEVCFDADYLVKGKKGDKQIYSLTFGNSKYLMPLKALETYNKKGKDLISDRSFKKENVFQTGYAAYCDFIAGGSSILLGTQRDLFRIENRVKLGKISDVICEQVFGFTDLVQFIMMSDGVGKEKKKYVESFVDFLVQEESQQIVSNYGLFSVLNIESKNENNGIMQNITPHNFSDYVVPFLFVSQDEIKILQKF